MLGKDKANAWDALYKSIRVPKDGEDSEENYLLREKMDRILIWKEELADHFSICTECDKHTNDARGETKWSAEADPYCTECFKKEANDE